MLVSNLHPRPHRLCHTSDADPVDPVGKEDARQQVIGPAHDDTLRGGLGRDHIERFGIGDPQTFPLPHSEAMHAAMLAENFAALIDNLALRCLLRNALFPEVGVDKPGVVTVRHEADFLAVPLLGNRQTEFPRQFANLRLRHPPERKQRPRQLRLRQAEQEIGLVLGLIDRAAQFEPPGGPVLLNAGVMPGRDLLRPNALCHREKLIELHEVVAECARDGRSTGQILVDERLDYLLLEPLLEVDHVIGNAQMLGHPAGIVHVVQRTAASRGRTRLQLREAALIP